MQYAYARANSVLKKYENLFPGQLESVLQQKYDFSSVTESEKLLVKMLSDYPKIVESAGKNKAPNLLTKYLEELAGAFHSLWAPHSSVKLIDENDIKTTNNHMFSLHLLLYKFQGIDITFLL